MLEPTQLPMILMMETMFKFYTFDVTIGISAVGFDYGGQTLLVWVQHAQCKLYHNDWRCLVQIVQT